MPRHTTLPRFLRSILNEMVSLSPKNHPFVIKAVFHFNRIVTKRRISLFREHSGRTNDMDTILYATFRYDMVEVENGLKDLFTLLKTYNLVFDSLKKCKYLGVMD